MRQNDSLTIRCTSDVRSALEQIGGPGRFSDTVRRALNEFVERNRSAQQPKAECRSSNASGRDARAAA